jgi:hypothetical protein
MKAMMLSATLIALLGSTGAAMAQNWNPYVRVDCMDRDGGPSGCSTPYSGGFNYGYGYGGGRYSYYGNGPAIYGAPYEPAAPAYQPY